MNTSIDSKIKTILDDYIDREYSLESRFVDDLDFDSLEVVDLVVEMETVLEVDFRDQDIEEIRTVGDLIRMATRKINGDESHE